MTFALRLTVISNGVSGIFYFGDDIRIEIDCLNHSVDVNKKIKHGSEMTLNIPVGSFTTDRYSFSLPLVVKVMERDLIYNDVGSAEKEVKVDVTAATPQHATVSIAIEETRNYKTKKKAVFEITFEAKVTETVSYLDPAHSKGGWTVVLSDAKKRVSLPDYIMVRLERQTPQRQYFKILEGGEELRGRKASVQIEPNGVRHLKA